MEKILITGAAGGLGKLVRAELKVWAKDMRINDLADLGEAAPHEEILNSNLRGTCNIFEAAHPTPHCDGPAVRYHGGTYAKVGPFEAPRRPWFDPVTPRSGAPSCPEGHARR